MGRDLSSRLVQKVQKVVEGTTSCGGRFWGRWEEISYHALSRKIEKVIEGTTYYEVHLKVQSDFFS